MNFQKSAILLGITVVSLMGAMYYFNSGKTDVVVDIKDFRSQGIKDLEFRVTLFKDWMIKYNKKYGFGESAMRFAIWNKMYDFVQEHNAKGLSWKVGINQFSDLTREEFAAMYLGYRPRADRVRNVVYFDETSNNPSSSVDWRNKSAVNAIKNQGQCGGCWSFSANAALEALNAIKGGTLTSYSEQQLIDCSGSYGNQGCNGGLMDDAFQYVRDKGVQTEGDYPYTAADGSCQYDASKVVYQNKNYSDVTTNSPTQLKIAVSKQVVSVAIEADQSAFQSYTSGIISSNCGTSLDHGVAVVGYASNYWIVRNSWGTSWGEQGYVRIASGTQNSGAGVCGINSDPSYPTA